VSGSRIIRLRRPPVVVATEGRFVPPGVDLDAVDARWNALCAANPKYFDGSMLQVLGTSRNGHGGVQIHVQECSYRFYAVQRADGAWPGLDCGVRPLGVKGIARRGDEVLLGRRSQRVAFYPGLWEFAPGGGLEPGIDPAAQVGKELEEETGIAARSAPIAIALLYDPVAFTWEIVHRLELPGGATPELGWEYDEFRFVARDALPEPLAAVAEMMRVLL
jgi:ADP-ribose pyrophosphatase YjhB (NUDIX family)